MPFAKAGRYDEALLQNRGGRGDVKAVTSADVYVYESDGVTEATLYTDSTKGTGADNPTAPSANGNLEFYVDPGEYVIKVYVDGVLQFTDSVFVHPDPSEDFLTLADAGAAYLVPAVEAVRYVTAAGSDSNSGRSWGVAFATIAAALADLPSGQRGRVLVGSAALFEEGLSVASGDTVTIEAAGWGRTVITGSGGTFLTNNGSGKVTVSGLALTGFDDQFVFSGTDIEMELVGNESYSNTGNFVTHTNQATDTISLLAAHRNHIHDNSGSGKVCGFRLNVDEFDTIRVTGNIIEDLTSTGDYCRGVFAGNIAVADGSSLGAVFVDGNVIRRLTGAGEVQSVMVGGQDVFVNGNLCHTTTQTGAADTEGIYTKALRGRVHGNTVVDCGDDAGGVGSGSAITIKGKRRDESGAPFGYGMRVTDNHVYETRSVGAGGILLDCEEVLVQGNHVDGCDGDPLYITSACRNSIQIIDNTFINGRAQSICTIRNYASKFIFARNTLSGADNGGGETRAFDIHLETDASSNVGEVTFTGNHVFDLTSAAEPTPSLTVAFRVRCEAGTVADIVFDHNMVDADKFYVGDGAGTITTSSLTFLDNYLVGSTDLNAPSDSRVVLADGSTATFGEVVIEGGPLKLDNDEPVTAKDSGGTYRTILQLSSGDLVQIGNANYETRVLGTALRVLGDIRADGDVDFDGIPTSDPSHAGRLWNDSGTLKISAG